MSAADWLVLSPTPAEQLTTAGPDQFPAFARLRFIRDPLAVGEAEADVDLGEDHPTDLVQARRTLDHLAQFTSTPDDCLFCVWDGYSDVTIPDDVHRNHLVRLPHRNYALMRGPLADLAAWESAAPPAYVWPADQAWCFTSDVDPHWAGIGASHAAIEALVAAKNVDVVRADPREAQPHYA